MLLLLQVLATGLTLGSLWFGGRKSLWGPILGVIGFLPWSALMLIAHTPLMILTNLVITGLHIRTFILWRNNAKS